MIKNISLFTLVIFTLFSFTNQTKPKPVAKKAVAKSTTPAAKKTTKISVNSKTKKEEILEVSTDFGKMYIWLYNATPLHKANILKLAKNGFDYKLSKWQVWDGDFIAENKMGIIYAKKK